MQSAVREARANFKSNLESVYRLLDFDQVVLDFAIDLVDSLHGRLMRSQGSPQLNGENILLGLRNARSHESLRPQYEAIYNQCVVLLVAYFGVALEGLFTAAAFTGLRFATEPKVLREELKLTV